MKNLSLALLAMFSLFAISCQKTTGEGPVVNETRNITNFNGIDQRISASVYYTEAPTYGVVVSAQQNILGVLQTYVSNNRLVIKFKEGVRVKSHEAIRVDVSAPAVNSLRLSGSGNLYVQGPFAPSTLELDISGSGDRNLTALNTAYLDANISGSGNIRIAGGTATEEKLKISGSGNLNLENVSAARVTTTTSGSGVMRVTATETLNVTISGSGSVYYKGTPQVNATISGSGTVNPF